MTGIHLIFIYIKKKKDYSKLLRKGSMTVQTHNFALDGPSGFKTPTKIIQCSSSSNQRINDDDDDDDDRS